MKACLWALPNNDVSTLYYCTQTAFWMPTRDRLLTKYMARDPLDEVKKVNLQLIPSLMTFIQFSNICYFCIMQAHFTYISEYGLTLVYSSPYSLCPLLQNAENYIKRFCTFLKRSDGNFSVDISFVSHPYTASKNF